jgi:hypothetical protein
MKKTIYFLGCLALFSCQEEGSTTTKSYYDLAGVIHQQIKELSKNKPIISKLVSLNNEKETLKTNAIDWEKELSLFLEADLNKKAYQQSYVVSKTDSSETYQLKATEDLPVKFLKLVFDEKKHLKNLEAHLKTKNYLYESEKNLNLSLVKNKLRHYEIKATQSLFIGQKKEFNIKGIVE